MRTFALLLAAICVIGAAVWYFYFRGAAHPEPVQRFKKAFEATRNRRWGDARELIQRGSPAWSALEARESACRATPKDCPDHSDFSWRLESVKKHGGEAVLKLEVRYVTHARGDVTGGQGTGASGWMRVWGVMVKDDGGWKLKQSGSGDDAWKDADGYLSGGSSGSDDDSGSDD